MSYHRGVGERLQIEEIVIWAEKCSVQLNNTSDGERQAGGARTGEHLDDACDGTDIKKLSAHGKQQIQRMFQCSWSWWR